MADTCKDLVEVNRLQGELEGEIQNKGFLKAYHAAKRWIAGQPDQDRAMDAVLIAYLTLRQRAGRR